MRIAGSCHSRQSLDQVLCLYHKEVHFGIRHKKESRLAGSTSLLPDRCQATSSSLSRPAEVSAEPMDAGRAET
jgi:hypothetical protein